MKEFRTTRPIAALSLLALLLLAGASHSYVGAQALVGSTAIGGDSVYGMAYDSGKGEMFVAAQDFFGDSNSILVLSDTNNAVVANISLGSNTEPLGIAYDSAKGEIFVANSSGSDVLVISDVTDKVTTTIPGFTDGPESIAYDPAKGEIFVGSGLLYGTPGSVSVISDATNSVVTTIPVDEYPESIAYDPTRGEMFVTSAGADEVSVISDSNDSVVATVNVGSYPSSIVYDSAKGEMYVADTKQNAVSVIDDATDSVVSTITSSDFFGPTGMAYDPTTGEVFVGNQGNATTLTNDISVISDTTNSVEAVNAGIPGSVLGYDPATGEVLVGGSAGDSISVISVGAASVSVSATSSSSVSSTQVTTANSTVCFTYTLNAQASTYCGVYTYTTTTGSAGPGQIGVGTYPLGMAYDSAKGEVFVADVAGPTVSVVSDATSSVVATVDIPGVDDPALADSPSPQFIAYDPGKGELFVSNQGGNCVTVISDTNNSVIATINLGNQTLNNGEGLIPEDLVYDSAKGEIFVADYGVETVVGSYPNNTLTSTGFVSVISDSTDKVVDTIPVGELPNAIAYDPSRGEVFVANYGKTPNDTSASNTADVSVISDSNDTVVDTIPVAASPDGMSYDSARGEMFVSSKSGTVSVISDSQDAVVATVPVPDAGESAYDPAQGEVFVVSYNDNSTYVVSDASNSVIRTVPDSQSPFGIVYDSGTSAVLVSNPKGDTVSVISDSTASTSVSTTSTKSSSTALEPSYLAMAAANVAALAIVGALRLSRMRQKTRALWV